MLRSILSNAVRVVSAGTRAPIAPAQAAQAQKRFAGISHPGQTKGLHWHLGFTGNRFGRQTIVRQMGMRTAGTHIPLTKAAAHTANGTMSFRRRAENPFIRFQRDHYKRMLGEPELKAIIGKLQIRKPRRPNSGKILCCTASVRKPSIRTGEPVATKLRSWIGNKGSPLREYSVVQVQPKHKRGIQTKYFCRWARYDFPANKETFKKKRAYGGQLGY